MPTLISLSDGTPHFFYSLYGTQDFTKTLNWIQYQGAISDTADLTYYTSQYDGYTMSLFNMNIEYEIQATGDHSLLCLYSKTDCNCTICAGLHWDDENEVPGPYAVYYQADDFFSWAHGDISEPTGTDISKGWFAVNVGGDYADDITAAVGDQFNVWRFQPNYQTNLINYGQDYRFQKDDTVYPYIWNRVVITDDSNEVTISDYFTYDDSIEFTLMAGNCLVQSVFAAVAVVMAL